jgi:two-component system, OmpR family, sensor histidine kinase TorS
MLSIPHLYNPHPKLTILVIEDNINSLMTLARLLRMDGHVVRTANGYQAALDVAKSVRFDVALCDIVLWDGNGCDLLKELQKLQPLKAIAVTGFALSDEVEQYRSAGFADVLAKPYRYWQLSSAINEVAAPQAAAAAAGTQMTVRDHASSFHA